MAFGRNGLALLLVVDYERSQNLLSFGQQPLVLLRVVLALQVGALRGLKQLA